MDPATLGLIGAAAISTAGSLYANSRNIKYQEGANDAQIALANTAHQREVRDLEAAGLNPILSAQSSGAAVPQLMAPNIDNPTEGISSAMKAAASLNSRQARAQIALSKSQEGVNSAQAENLRYDGALKKAQADLIRSGMENTSNASSMLEEAADAFRDLDQMKNEPPHNPAFRDFRVMNPHGRYWTWKQTQDAFDQGKLSVDEFLRMAGKFKDRFPAEFDDKYDYLFKKGR